MVIKPGPKLQGIVFGNNSCAFPFDFTSDFVLTHEPSCGLHLRGEVGITKQVPKPGAAIFLSEETPIIPLSKLTVRASFVSKLPGTPGQPVHNNLAFLFT